MNNKLFWFIDLLILFIFLKLISLSFNLSGSMFKLQFIVLVVLLILGGLTLLKDKYSLWFFLISLIDTLIQYSHFETRLKLIIIPLGAGIIGLALSLKQPEEEEDNEVTEFELEETPETKVLLEEYAPEEKKSKFSPGKFLASKYGKTYHAPKCTWAKKIKKKSQVWLEDNKEANKKGYKKHNCL